MKMLAFNVICDDRKVPTSVSPCTSLPAPMVVGLNSFEIRKYAKCFTSKC